MLHDHRKPRPHFDLRLEENGVLRSWAVPRGLPTDPAKNRLAVSMNWLWIYLSGHRSARLITQGNAEGKAPIKEAADR